METSKVGDTISNKVRKTLEEAKQDYANFCKINTNILMVLSESNEAYFFVHKKGKYFFKTAVTKKENDFLAMGDTLTKEDIETYEKWLSSSNVA